MRAGQVPAAAPPLEGYLAVELAPFVERAEHCGKLFVAQARHAALLADRQVLPTCLISVVAQVPDILQAMLRVPEGSFHVVLIPSPRLSCQSDQHDRQLWLACVFPQVVDEAF